MFTVAGYELDRTRRYDQQRNLWVDELGAGKVRIGLDPLGAQTAGDIVAISFAPLGAELRVGDTFATIEAAKFVGPLHAPVSGTVASVSNRALLAPGAINADPFGVWLIELAGVQTAELEPLLFGEAAVRPWFERAVERLRSEGVIAE
jgi:glycine cleavage system H protein